MHARRSSLRWPPRLVDHDSTSNFASLVMTFHNAFSNFALSNHYCYRISGNFRFKISIFVVWAYIPTKLTKESHGTQQTGTLWQQRMERLLQTCRHLLRKIIVACLLALLSTRRGGDCTEALKLHMLKCVDRIKLSLILYFTEKHVFLIFVGLFISIHENILTTKISTATR